jgi:hypothetical protein
MQFVIMKPLLALSVVRLLVALADPSIRVRRSESLTSRRVTGAQIVMEWLEVYHEGSFSPKAGYFWVVVTQNVCITLAMYALVLFYHAVAKELQPFKPIPKFLCIKAIIGFAFWCAPFVMCACAREQDMVADWRYVGPVSGRV